MIDATHQKIAYKAAARLLVEVKENHLKEVCLAQIQTALDQECNKRKLRVHEVEWLEMEKLTAASLLQKLRKAAA